MADPWLVTPGERAKHEEQFNTLRPVGGFITGEQAKGFFLQSRLPPPVLGIIWALSDVDGDGKMDLHEFSIACKLINLKLRGFNLPQTLPASLKQSACGGTAVTATHFPGVGTSMGPGTSNVGVVAGVGVAGLTGLDSGLSVTPARAPGPVVSPMVISASVLPPAAPISAPVPVAPVSVPAVPAAAAPPVAAIPPLTAAPSNLTSSMPGTMPRSIPDMTVESTAAAVPGAIPCMVSGVMSGSVAGSMPGIVSGPTAGAGQSSVVPSVPTAVPPAHDPVAVAAGAYVSPVGTSPAAPPPGSIMTGGTTVRPMQPMVSGMAPQMVPAQPLVPAAPSSIAPTSMASTCVASVSMVAPSIASAPLVPAPMVPPIAPVSQAVQPNIAQPVQVGDW
ncbi:uncharacterized protein [Panulirus ornatus]|uniref:uncharacterized protein isoform X1 n=1 Tax=Panulirus ornatus TaxID=150431 RepID=UPI003A8AF3E4